MQYNTYHGCNDYNAVQKFEKIDLNNFKFLGKQPYAFKGKIVSVFQSVGKFDNLQWNVTMVNEQKGTKASFYIGADSNSMLAQQLLLITTGKLESIEKEISSNGNTYTVVSNITGEVVVTLAYLGQSAKDIPIFKAVHFFYPNGASLEEVYNKAVEFTDWKKSFELAKKITSEIASERQAQEETKQKFAPQNVPQVKTEPSPFEIQGAEQGQPEEDIPF